MMTTTEQCSIFLLDVPEFAPLVRGLANVAGVTIEARGDYQVAQAAGEIVLLRSDRRVHRTNAAPRAAYVERVRRSKRARSSRIRPIVAGTSFAAAALPAKAVSAICT
jgi:hypothetical protein